MQSRMSTGGAHAHDEVAVDVDAVHAAYNVVGDLESDVGGKVMGSLMARMVVVMAGAAIAMTLQTLVWAGG